MTRYAVKKVEVSTYGASSQHIPLLFSSVDKCRDLITLAGDELKDWEIISTNGGLDEEVIDRSPAYKALLLKDADERAQWLEKQYNKVKAINTLPTRFESNLNLPVKITYTRSKAEFEPHVSRSIKWYLSVLIEGQDHHRVPWDYVTGSGQVQVKKFANDMGSIFGSDKAKRISPEVIRDIIKEYNNLKARIQNA